MDWWLNEDPVFFGQASALILSISERAASAHFQARRSLAGRGCALHRSSPSPHATTGIRKFIENTIPPQGVVRILVDFLFGLIPMFLSKFEAWLQLHAHKQSIPKLGPAFLPKLNHQAMYTLSPWKC